MSRATSLPAGITPELIEPIVAALSAHEDPTAALLSLFASVADGLREIQQAAQEHLRQRSQVQTLPDIWLE